jgi:hypothetical protein
MSPSTNGSNGSIVPIKGGVQDRLQTGETVSLDGKPPAPRSEEMKTGGALLGRRGRFVINIASEKGLRRPLWGLDLRKHRLWP